MRGAGVTGGAGTAGPSSLRAALLVSALALCGSVTAACGSDSPGAKATTGTSTSPSAAPSAQAAHSGPWIAFQWIVPDGDGLWLVEPDGDNRHQIITDNLGDEAHPAWSPDGTKLAFVVFSGDSGGVWVADADGGNARSVAQCRRDCLFYDYVAWVPGRHDTLLMVRDDGPTIPGTPVPGSSALELLDLKTGERRDVTTSARGQLFSAAAVSPDGKRYCAHVEIDDMKGSTGSAIVVGRMSGGAATMLTDPQEYAAYCDWHPDGDRLVYSTYDLNVFGDMSQDSNLYVVAPDGTHRQQITHFVRGKQRATQPRWTPDGDRILFTLVEGEGHDRQLATVTADGDDLQPATGEAVSGTHPVLQPTS